MNFIEALKSEKRFRHKNWANGLWCFPRGVNSFSLYKKNGIIEELHFLEYHILIDEMLDETGWEVYKEQKKVETTWDAIPCSSFIPNKAKVTIEWEE